MKTTLLFIVGIVSGSFIAFQSVLNAALGRRAGNLGAVLLVTLVSIVVVLLVILAVPAEANFKNLPGPRQWYLYAGGLLGIAIVLAPVILVPRIGATSTLTALIVGQLITALILDQVGILGGPRIAVTAPRLIGAVLLVSGAFMIARY